MSNKKSLNNRIKEAGTKGKDFLHRSCPVSKQRETGHH